MGARAVVWVATAAVLGAQLAPWRLPAPGLAGVGAVLAVVAGLRRHRVLALAAVAVLAASAGRAAPGFRRRDRRLQPATSARSRCRSRTTLEGEVADVRRLAGRERSSCCDALSVDDGGTRRRVDGRVRLTARGGLPKLRARRPRPGRDDAAARRAASPIPAASTSPAISRGAACGSIGVGLGVPARSSVCRGRPRGARDAARALARAAGARDRARACRRRARPSSRALVLGDESGIDDAAARGVHPRRRRARPVRVRACTSGSSRWRASRWLAGCSAGASALLLALDVRRIAAPGEPGPGGALRRARRASRSRRCAR